MESICINSSPTMIGLAAAVVTTASMVANFIPAPDKIENPILRGISRVVHFAAFDIVTAAQKK